MKHLIFLITLISILLESTSLRAQQAVSDKSLEDKEVFELGFPKTLSFRNDKWLLTSNYEQWEKGHIQTNGITKKYLQEETNMPPIAAQWASNYVQDHPEKLMLVHLNGEARSVNDKATFNKYFPGHWVYEKGSELKEDIQKNQKTILLDDASPFSLKAYQVHGHNTTIAFRPHDILLVKIDQEGNRIWDDYEFATLEAVDYQTNAIVIKRGQHGTKARSFSKSNTYIAPVAGDIWGGNLMFYYNLSSACPLDHNGQTAADVFLCEMKEWFGKGGQLENIDGIGFDVNYFKVKHKTWDCNNDGIIDNGLINGKNIWQEGDLHFLENIRKTFGPEFIITADGWNDGMQRAVGILNGMESEGLCRWNDGFRQISRTINQHMYWNIHNSAAYKFSYITSKLRNPNDILMADQLRRLGLGISSCLGVTYSPSANLKIPETVGGILNQPNWLGQPTGPMRYVLDNKIDLLEDSGVTMSNAIIKRFDLEKTTYKTDNGQLFLKGTDLNHRKDMVLKGPEIKAYSGDLLILLEAKAVDGLLDVDAESLVPRKINIRLEGLPKYPEEPMNSHLLYNDLSGFMGVKGYTPLMYYFRNVGNTNLQLIFEVEEQGEFVIKNLQIFNSSCLITREFQNGLVIANPSLQPINLNSNQIFSDQFKYQGLEIPNKIETLKTNADIPINIPALDALFIIKKDL
ncbi:hypothetical protein [Leeuwenhoekiella parthenopeia]|uniref:Alpha-galactosidase n=1 Tax=Leeuwenhoekiella parthenopeia TaxID=2890320 RepID=A0ABS8GQK6_9FLAO|nr:hypothetical protein [Leeuwenhoekiella parthenopeia]MCC4211998.1 hypothetical protein [Leeuwenhoekiella parthenopeia]